jgi:hypothetical protein
MGQSKLPLEVREKIYGYVVGHTTPTVTTDLSGRVLVLEFPFDDKDRKANVKVGLNSLNQLNRQIKLEDTLVFIRQATFDVRGGLNPWLELCAFLPEFPHNQGFEAVRSLLTDSETLLAYFKTEENPQGADMIKMFPWLKVLAVNVLWDAVGPEEEARLLEILCSGTFRKVKLSGFPARCRHEFEEATQNWKRVEAIRDAIKNVSKNTEIEFPKSRLGDCGLHCLAL